MALSALTPNIMKKEEDVHQKEKLKMSTAVQAETAPSDGYINASGASYYYHEPFTTTSFHRSNEVPPVGHPPTMQHHSLPNPPHMVPYYHPHPDGYSTAQYVPEPGYVAQPPGHPPPQQHYHPAPPQQVYYGSWPGVTPVHYASYPTWPPEAQNRGHRSSRNKRDQYGALELDALGDGYKNLVPALNFVKRSSKATLFDIDGIIPDIARADEGASRFIQKRFKVGTIEEKRLGLAAALSSLDDLWSDHYGNFLLQGIFEFGTAEMKKQLMDAIYDGQDVVALCLHMHGCRVIQKAIRCLGREDVCKLMTEFHDQVLTFIHDPNGNHVIQRCIQVMSSFAKCAANSGDPDLASSLSDQMQFIIDDIVANVETLSTHRYGCRVVQRAIEHCVEEQKTVVLEMILSCHRNLLVDQYGNYVMQQVLACGSDDHQAVILKTLTENGALLSMSRHKYASNVVEAVLMHGKSHHKKKILEEMLKDTREDVGGYCCAIELSKDPIANYVVNKALEVSEADQRENLFELISSSREELTKSPYAKYVLQKIDKRDK